jgi:DNA primase
MLKRIPEDVVEEVRKANDIVDVVSEYVQLKKQGRNYFGLCPFHGEKTPSFSVTPEKQIFYCFGCKKGGNVLTFLMELENYSFFESVRILAEKSGIDLPDTNTTQESSLSQENQSILSAHDWLTKLYHHLLKYTQDGKEGYEYVKARGINDESIEQFQLGFAPLAKEFTAEFLESKGFHQQLLVKAGLLNLLEDNSIVDRFAGRVIFPIRNHLGKTVAFGGRTITGQQPKYINSSESELFQKSRILFNFDLAKRHIRKANEVILFEGQMDVISAYQAGVKNVVATLGTSLTDSQAKLLKRYVDTVVVCYDDDQAGINASFSAANLLRKVGCQVKVANLRNGMDPDAYIKEFGVEAFTDRVIKASDTYISFYMRYLKKDYNLSVEADRIQYIQQVLKQLAMIDSSVEREHYLKDLSDEYNLSLATLNDEVHTFRKKIKHQHNGEQNRYTSSTPSLRQPNKLLPAFQNAERFLISYMLQDAFVTERVQSEIGVNFTMDDHKIIATHLYAFYEDVETPDVSKFIDRLEDEKLKQLVIEIAMLPLLDNISDQEINDYIHIIQAQKKDVAILNDYREQQRLAEQQNDPIKAATIALEIIAIERQLKNTK